MMRLDKLISHSTVFTRSQTGKLIRKGLIKVNGKVIKKSAYKILPDDHVHYLGIEINQAKKRYIMLYKPKDVVCATSDREHKTVLDLLFISNRKKLHIAGRLDIDTTGLVLITDDGQWSHRITSPKHKQAKIYRVSLTEAITAEAIQSLRQGILLKGEKKPTLATEVTKLNNTTLLLTLNEGRYHQIKRMLTAVGYHVIALHRQQIGTIRLDPNLSTGEWRELNQREINLNG